MTNPKTFTKQQIVTTSDQDALQIKDIKGDVVGWIDSTGTGQGNLAGGSGNGTVIANSGTAGAIAYYSSAGGSTTVGPEPSLAVVGTTNRLVSTLNSTVGVSDPQGGFPLFWSVAWTCISNILSMVPFGLNFDMHCQDSGAGTSIAQAYAIQARVYGEASQGIAQGIIGIKGQANQNGTGTVSYLAGVETQCQNLSGHTVTTSYGVLIDSNAGVATTNWAVYSPGNVNSLFGGPIVMGTTTGPSIRTGSGSPEGAVTAPVGSLYTRTDGGANTTLYVKESGAGNTGWVAK